MMENKEQNKHEFKMAIIITIVELIIICAAMYFLIK